MNRRKVLGLLMGIGPASKFMSGQQRQTAISEDALFEQIKSHNRGIAIWWMGNSGWLLKSGSLLFATDLDLESANKIYAPPVSAERLSGELDIAFATHHHGDHFNVPTAKILAKNSRCQFVLPKTCLKFAEKAGIPEKRITVPAPGAPFEVKGLRVEPIHAIHGNQEFTVLTREPDFIDSITHNCGYIFNLQQKRILQPGDSVLTEEHLNLKKIDALFLSPTVHNMYVDRSMILINKLEPAHIFPQHFETYVETPENQFWTKGYPDELFLRLSGDLKKRYHKLRQGEMFVVT
jgi:L-ascorbate 6-phosphate lactonase